MYGLTYTDCHDVELMTTYRAAPVGSIEINLIIDLPVIRSRHDSPGGGIHGTESSPPGQQLISSVGSNKEIPSVSGQVGLNVRKMFLQHLLRSS